FLWPEKDFPRSSTQKPRTNVIQQVAHAHVGAKSGEGTAAGSLAELVARITRRTAGELRPGTNLEADLNLSSLDRVELMGALEDRYQVDLSETRFAAVKTVNDLERLL